MLQESQYFLNKYDVFSRTKLDGITESLHVMKSIALALVDILQRAQSDASTDVDAPSPKPPMETSTHRRDRPIQAWSRKRSSCSCCARFGATRPTFLCSRSPRTRWRSSIKS